MSAIDPAIMKTWKITSENECIAQQLGIRYYASLPTILNTLCNISSKE